MASLLYISYSPIASLYQWRDKIWPNAMPGRHVPIGRVKKEDVMENLGRVGVAKGIEQKEYDLKYLGDGMEDDGGTQRHLTALLWH